MEGEGESDGALSYTNGMIFSSAPHWLEFVPAEGLAVCEYVCSTFRIVGYMFAFGSPVLLLQVHNHRQYSTSSTGWAAPCRPNVWRWSCFRGARVKDRA